MKWMVNNAYKCAIPINARRRQVQQAILPCQVLVCVFLLRGQDIVGAVDRPEHSVNAARLQVFRLKQLLHQFVVVAIGAHRAAHLRLFLRKPFSVHTIVYRCCRLDCDTLLPTSPAFNVTVLICFFRMFHMFISIFTVFSNGYFQI